MMSNGPSPYEHAREHAAAPQRPPAPLRFEAFPTGALPESLRDFVEASARAIGCDVAMIGPAVLATLAGCIGATRRIRLSGDWAEPCVVWSVCVAPSGSLKSPAIEKALEPVRAWEAERMKEHAEAMRDHRAAMLRHERALKDWKANGDGDPPDEPDRPTAQRVIVADVTCEALAVRLAENPRGLLMARDELAGWVRGFDAYRKGRGGDAAAWMETHGARPLIVDRKGGDTIHVPRAAVSVCGTVQPGIAERLLRGEHTESGLTARLLISAPPIPRKRWRKASTPAHVRRGYADIVRELLALDFGAGADGEAEPIDLALTPEAETIWARWYDTHAERMEDASDDALRAALAKIEGYGPRFALIIHLAALADARSGGAHAPEPIAAEAMRGGIALADWFAGEAERFHAGLDADESEDERRTRELAEWVHKRGGCVSASDLTHGLRRFRGRPEAARQALEELAGAGYGAVAWETGDNGGRPSFVFRLHTGPGVTDTETPRHGGASGGFGDGDSGDTRRAHADGEAVAP